MVVLVESLLNQQRVHVFRRRAEEYGNEAEDSIWGESQCPYHDHGSHGWVFSHDTLHRFRGQLRCDEIVTKAPVPI
jgi:hypothetical protein